MSALSHSTDRVRRRSQAALPPRVAGRCAATALMLFASLLPMQVCAQSSSASYAIPRQSIDGGAARSNSAAYTVEATLAQPDADTPLSSASYQLQGGFQRPLALTGPLPDALFEDGFETR